MGCEGIAAVVVADVGPGRDIVPVEIVRHDNLVIATERSCPGESLRGEADMRPDRRGDFPSAWCCARAATVALVLKRSQQSMDIRRVDMAWFSGRLGGEP